MARIGGRNTAFAWVVGVVCTLVIGVLAVLTVPILPAVFEFGGVLLRAAFPDLPA